MPRPNLVGIIVFALLTITFSSVSFADEAGYSSKVVQNRKFFGTHEFDVAVGLLPLDAFTKGVTFGGSYTIHFSEKYAWEVLQYNYSLHVDTNLREELKAFELRSTPFELLEQFVMSHFIYKPIYWKGSWLNDSLLYGEFFLATGGGYGWFTHSGKAGVDVGGGFRLFASEIVSFRFDLRYLFFFDSTIIEEFDYKDEVWLSLGTSLTF